MTLFWLNILAPAGGKHRHWNSCTNRRGRFPLSSSVAPCSVRRWRTSLQKVPTIVLERITLVIFPWLFIGLWMRKHCAMNATEPKSACGIRKHATAPWQEIYTTYFDDVAI